MAEPEDLFARLGVSPFDPRGEDVINPMDWGEYPIPSVQIFSDPNGYNVIEPTTPVTDIVPTGGDTIIGTFMPDGWFGQEIIIRNSGSYNLTLQGGTPWNFRMIGGLDVVLAPGEHCQFMFITNSLWVQLAPKQLTAL